jgi:hypothetical protein
MLTTKNLKACISPNFVLDRNSDKPFQTIDTWEGNKSAAVIMFIGISDIYNIPKKDTMSELGIDYKEYRHKLSVYKISCEEARKKLNDRSLNSQAPLEYDRVDRFYNKLLLVQNAIRFLFSSQYIDNSILLETN